jgi:hypothetical protein
MTQDMSAAQNNSNQGLKGADGDMYAFNRPEEKGLGPPKASSNNLMNNTNMADGEGSLQELPDGDLAKPPGMNSIKLKEDDGPSLGKPFDYDFDDLASRDKESGKLSCCKCMSMVRHICFVLLFLGAIAGAFVLPLGNNGKVKTVNSYIAALPLKEKDIKISEIALNYMVHLSLSKDQNS